MSDGNLFSKPYTATGTVVLLLVGGMASFVLAVLLGVFVEGGFNMPTGTRVAIVFGWAAVNIGGLIPAICLTRHA